MNFKFCFRVSFGTVPYVTQLHRLLFLRKASGNNMYRDFTSRESGNHGLLFKPSPRGSG